MTGDQNTQTTTKKSPRRRSRRRLARYKSSAEDIPKVVGLDLEGGNYKPLSDYDIEQIHRTALDVLENIGVANPIPELLEVTLNKGCFLEEQGRLCFPHALIEDVIAKIPKEVMNFGPNPKNDILLTTKNLVFSTGGEAVSILDYKSRRYRPSTLIDLYDAGRLVDQLEHIHTFGQPFIASEYSQELFVHDINIAYAQLAATDKSFHLGIGEAKHIEPIISLFDIYAGGEGKFLKRPFCSLGGCPIVSPLTFARDSVEVMMKCVALGINYDIAVAAQAGATSPAALAGTLVQTFAETMACQAIVYLINPTASISFGMWPFIADLRTGSFTGGSAEQALVMAATAQICRYYGLVSSVATGMSDANSPDTQAGFEKAITTLAAALAGGNSVCTYPGSVGSIMGTSFEGLLIDNDMLGNVLRVVRGIEVNEETLSYQTIKTAVYGEGHFLSNLQTLNLMKTEYLYPNISDRRDTATWEDAGSPDIYEQAHQRVKSMLTDYYPQYIKAEADRKIREHFDIRLTPQAMRPGNGRW